MVQNDEPFTLTFFPHLDSKRQRTRATCTDFSREKKKKGNKVRSCLSRKTVVLPMGLLQNSEGRDKGGTKLVRPETMNDKQQALQVGD